MIIINPEKKCIKTYVTIDELGAIRSRMKNANMKVISAYMKKMALGGYVLTLDLSDLNEVARLQRINSNNLNQYAKKANETGSIYLTDIENLQRQQQEIWEMLGRIYRKLAAL